MFCRIVVAAALVLLAVSDVRSLSIPVWPVPVLAAFSVCSHLILGDFSAVQILAGVLPGLILMLICAVHPASVGRGDALLITVCGAGIGFFAEFEALVTALFLCGAYAAWLLVRKKAKGNDCLPFLPFLAAGHILMTLAEAVL